MDTVPSAGFAQQFCDDVVIAEGCFTPNAWGRFELSSFRALADRQLLKSQASFFAERILVAVTPIEVVAIATDALSLLRRRCLTWSRAELRVQLVPSRALRRDPGSSALFLSRRGWWPRLEIAPRVDDPRCPAVIDFLTGSAAPRNQRI